MTDPSAKNARSVIVCDRQGMPLRTAGLLEVHQGVGVLHKAFSVFVFRNAGTELLLQQRSRHKALFPLRWANTCCSHPSPADPLLVEAAERRLREEFGFFVALREAGSFIYRAKDPDADFSEHEHDTVFVGDFTDEAISLQADPTEIAAWQWLSISDLQRDLGINAKEYAPWLPEALHVALASPRMTR